MACLTNEIGPQIREALAYCVLDLLREGRRTAREIAEVFREKSSKDLEVPIGEVQKAVEQMAESGHLSAVEGRFGLTDVGVRRLEAYSAAKEEAKKRSEQAKETAVERLISRLDRRPDRRVLDVGTGEGYLAIRLAQAGFNVVGVDLNPERIRKAREKAQEAHIENAKFEVGDITDSKDLGLFDCAVARYVVHHLENQEAALKGICGILKPGGKLICIDYRVGLIAFFVHGFITFRAPSEADWPELLGRCGYRESKTYPIDDLLIVEAVAAEPVPG